MPLTLKEEMAIAVLRGDDGAAAALADRLIEERLGIVVPEPHISVFVTPTADDGYTVYHWPEFRALMERMGIDWRLRTISISFAIEVGKRVEVLHRIAAQDRGESQ